MELGEAFESVGEFELEASWLVDACGNDHLIVDWRRGEVEADLVDPLATVLGTDLEVGQDVLGDERQDVEHIFNPLLLDNYLAASCNLDDVSNEVVVTVPVTHNVQSQGLSVVVLREGQGKVDDLLSLGP